MAIEFVRGDILADESADYLVIPVNCVGKPGMGLAKQWAEQAPEIALRNYYSICRDGKLHPGDVIFPADDSTYILAATKDHWVQSSQYDWIEQILLTLRNHALDHKWWDTSIALPKLGCGVRTGRLRWAQVRDMMVYHLEQIPTRFIIYE
jgi:O-acetyl-ADP-ribose deacetylase (regulator of RNase III)